MSFSEKNRISEWVCIGLIQGAFGVRGEIRIQSFTEIPESCFSYGIFYTEEGQKFLSPKHWRKLRKGFAFFAEEVPDRETAETLKGKRLYIHKTCLPVLEEEEYYHKDLIGLEVYDVEGRFYGRVITVQNFGSADLLEILAEAGSFLLETEKIETGDPKAEQSLKKKDSHITEGSTFYLPFLKKYIKEILPEAGKVLIEAYPAKKLF